MATSVSKCNPSHFFHQKGTSNADAVPNTLVKFTFFAFPNDKWNSHSERFAIQAKTLQKNGVFAPTLI